MKRDVAEIRQNMDFVGCDNRTALEMCDEIDRLRAEVADLKISVCAFGAQAMVRYAYERGLPNEHLHPLHYDILARAGARMDDFVRSDRPDMQARAEPANASKISVSPGFDGMDAARAGRPVEDCPYSTGRARTAWVTGWYVAKGEVRE